MLTWGSLDYYYYDFIMLVSYLDYQLLCMTTQSSPSVQHTVSVGEYYIQTHPSFAQWPLLALQGFRATQAGSSVTGSRWKTSIPADDPMMCQQASTGHPSRSRCQNNVIFQLLFFYKWIASPAHYSATSTTLGQVVILTN